MFEGAKRAAGEVRAELAALDAAALGGPEAMVMAEAYAELVALAQAGLTLAAGRVAATGAWAASGARSAKSYLSGVAGVSPGAAEAMIDLADRLTRFPATAEAFSSGLVSAAEANEVTRAAARNSEAEEGLLDTAQHSSFSRLRDKANATQSPSPEEDRRRAEAAHAGRSCRTWVDPDGVGHLHAKGPVDVIGVLAGRIGAREKELFADARNSGNHQPPGAYRFDALVDLVCHGKGADVPGAPFDVDANGDRPSLSGPGLFGSGMFDAGPDPFPAHAGPSASGNYTEGDVVDSECADRADTARSGPSVRPAGAERPGTGPPGRRRSATGTRPRVDMLIRVDFAAIRRGYPEEGEICEVAGVGPVPVARAVEYLGAAALKFILTEGVDIKAVAHTGRNIGAHLRSALLWRYRRCSVPGCDRALGLENDHEFPYAKGGMTSLDNIAPKCHVCHREKTRQDYPNGTASLRRRDGAPGARSLTTG